MTNFHRNLFLFGSLLGILMLVNGCTDPRILRMKDKEIITFDQMIQELKGRKMILIGELHDEPKHHEYELRIIKALCEQGIPISIGLEMVRANSQKVLDQWTLGDLPLERFLPVYRENWSVPWSLYKDIFIFARDQRIPLIGLNIPTEITNKVAQKGFSSLTEEETMRLPPGISCDVDSIYREFIMRAFRVHRMGEEFVNFCEAQMVWDNAMALHTLEYVSKNPTRTVIILTGTGHAWKRAIASQIERLSRAISIAVVLPEFPGEIERNIMTTEDTDFLILN